VRATTPQSFKIPSVVRRHLSDFQFLVERFDVFHTDPEPGPAAPLRAKGQADASFIARDAGEVIGAPAGVFKTQDIHVGAEGGFHIFHAEDWLTAFKTNAGLLDISHFRFPRRQWMP